MKVLIDGKEVKAGRCDIVYENYDGEDEGNDLHLKYTSEGRVTDIHNGDEMISQGYLFVDELID